MINTICFNVIIGQLTDQSVLWFYFTAELNYDTNMFAFVNEKEILNSFQTAFPLILHPQIYLKWTEWKCNKTQ